MTSVRSWLETMRRKWLRSPRSARQIASPRPYLELLEDRLAPAVVGYYDIGVGGGSTNQPGPILDAGHTPQYLDDLSSADLEGLDVLFVQNPSNMGYNSEFLSRLGDVEQAVSNGLVFILHDRWVDTAENVLPGGENFDLIRNFADRENINVLDSSTILTDGPGGIIDDTTLDNGDFSSHGYGVAGSLTGARLLLSTGDPDHVVTFSYAHGSGHVIYSSIPLDFHLGNAKQPNFGNIYAPNVVAYGVSLLNTPPVANPGTITVGEDSEVTSTLPGSDPDGDPLTFSIVDGPTSGSVTLVDPTTGSFVYTPDTDFNGFDSFVYEVSDGKVSSTATVTVEVTPVNDDPVVAVHAVENGVEGELLAFQASASDVENDPFEISWDFGDGQSASGSAVAHTYGDNGVYMVTVTVDDGLGGVTEETLEVTVSNASPVVDPLQDQTAAEGESVTLSGSFFDAGVNDTHTVLWEILDADSNVVASSDQDTITFVPADNGTFRAVFTVTDDDGGVGSSEAAITVENLPPTLLLTGSDSRVRWETATYLSGLGDPGSADTHTLQWQVTDSAGNVVAVGDALGFSFVPTQAGAYTITVTASDDDGASSTASQDLTVEVVQLRANSEDPTRTDLVVGGTSWSDFLLFVPDYSQAGVNVYLNGTSLGTFEPTGQLVAYGGGGNDWIQVNAGIQLGAVLHGGEGNDALLGGSGNDILFAGLGDDFLDGRQGDDVLYGEQGSDWLWGGSGNDLLVGGAGNDWLWGGVGDDILIGGDGEDWLWDEEGNNILVGDFTALENDAAALDAALAGWSSEGGNEQGNALLSEEGELAVHAVGNRDVLFGNRNDWVFSGKENWDFTSPRGRRSW
jgi:Ca2+-binding RTX toxin-like protein